MIDSSAQTLIGQGADTMTQDCSSAGSLGTITSPELYVYPEEGLCGGWGRHSSVDSDHPITEGWQVRSSLPP